MTTDAEPTVWARRLAVAGGAFLALAGAVLRAQDASPSWPIYRGDPGLRGIAAGALGDEFELAWRFETENAITASPVVEGGVVYVGSNDGNQYAIDFASGKKVWAFETEDIIESPSLVHGGRVYFGSTNYEIYCLDARDGSLVWKRETGAEIQGSANTVDLGEGRTGIVVGSYDARLYCFDAASGEPVWTYETGDRINGTPAIYKNADSGRSEVVFGGCDSVLHIVDTVTGKAARKVALGGDCYVAGSVGVADGRAYFGHYGNAFVCVDLTDGKSVWEYANPRHGFFSSPAITDEVVVFGGRDRQLHCLDRETGKARWTFVTRRKVDGSPVVAGDKVVFGSGDGRLYVLKLADASVVFEVDLGRPVFSSPAVVDGRIVVGCNDGSLSCFGPPKSKDGGR